MKVFKIILKIILIVVLVLVVVVGGFLCYGHFTSLRPKDSEEMKITGSESKSLALDDTIKILTWNTGYGGLGDNEDFFMDGGKNVCPKDQKRVEANLADIASKIKEINPDIALLQEVDEHSKRSFNINAIDYYHKQFGVDKYNASFAYNYLAGWVPYPVTDMIGNVGSGILSFSKYKMNSSTRIQLPVPFNWPISMFNLKRCLLVNRYTVGEKELVVVNLHLEAYDSGEGKIKQMAQLKDFLISEYQKGNYVIAGGDFNQTFSNIDDSMYPYQEGLWKAGKIDSSEMPGWQFMMDNRVPTCRSLDKPLKDANKSTFQFYMIDGFIVSQNVDINSLRTIDYGFVSTDHNPVEMVVKLK